MKKICIITPFFPFPAVAGGDMAQYNFISGLENLYAITIVAAIYNEDQLLNIDEFKKLHPRVMVEPIMYSEKPIKKTLLHRLFLRIERLFIKKENTEENKLEQEFRSSSSFIMNKPAHFINHLTEFLKSNQFDILQFEFIDFADLIFCVQSGAKKIFIQHEIRYERLRKAMSTISEIMPFQAYNLRKILSQEIGLLNGFDAVITLSEHDSILLKEAGLRSAVYTSTVGIIDKGDLSRTTSEKCDIIFIGGDHHYPNLDGLIWFKEYILPLVKITADFKIYVTGHWSAKNRALFDNAIFQFVGQVESFKSVSQNELISIVPLRIGSGIRMKIISSIENGFPVIATSIAAEGLDLINGKHAIIADTPENFAAAINQMRIDKRIREVLANNSFDYLKEQFTIAKSLSRRIEVYNNVLSA